MPVDPRDVRLRLAAVQDARAVAEVHLAGSVWAYRGLLPDDVVAARTVGDREEQWRAGLSAHRSDGGGALVAEGPAGRIVGFVAFGAAGDEHAAAPPPGAGEVYAIYLLEEAAGRGIGRRLLAGAVDELRVAGFRHAVLWVLETNSRARRFYERAGWRADGAVGRHRFDCDERPIVRYTTEI
jgi:ribosomal protein S18 acetylase RimI-like enzyme